MKGHPNIEAHGTSKHVPGKPVAYNDGLLSMNYGLFWGIVACYFGLLGFPGRTCGYGIEAHVG